MEVTAKDNMLEPVDPYEHDAVAESIETMPAGEVTRLLLQMGVDPNQPVPDVVLEKIKSLPPNLKKAGFVCLPGGDRGTDELETTLNQFAEAVRDHQVETCARLLTSLDRENSSLLAYRKNSHRVIYFIAQWSDIEPAYVTRIDELLKRFRQYPDLILTANQRAHIMMAEGFVYLHNEHYDQAITHFDYARCVADELRDYEMGAICRYNLSRSYWKMGLYSFARDFLPEAKELFTKVGRVKSCALVDMLDGWLLFQLGKKDAAICSLRRADEELKETDDYVNQANILSFYARIRRGEGQYDKSIALSARAIELYKRRNEEHRNIGRTLVNVAIVRHLKIRNVIPGSSLSREQLALGLEDLRGAQRIYDLHRELNHRGLGKVHLTRALFYFDLMELDKALSEAGAAYRLGADKGDRILMGKARRIQSRCEGSPKEALKFANDAIYYASRTDNRRLQAKALIGRADCLLRLPRLDLKEIEKCVDEANDRLTEEERKQPLWKDALATLREASRRVS